MTFLKKMYRRAVPTGDEKIYRRQKKKTAHIINEYFAKTAIKKLHIGCQDHLIEGWLNVDLMPGVASVAYMDATKAFPFPDETFDFIFSEHMIEHITLKEGYLMLQECKRVLKPGGVLRISTPDLQFLMDLYTHPKDALHQEYIEAYRRFFPQLSYISEAMVVNNFVRNWGHQFIYDKKTLAYLMQDAGFSGVLFCKVGESRYNELNNIERHGEEIGDAFNRLESFVVEGKK